MTISKLEAICYETDSYDIYRRSYQELMKLCDISEDEYILKICTKKDGTIRFLDTIKFGEVITFPKGKVLYHYCPVDVKELKSSFRSTDGCLYTGNRIYFLTKDEEIPDRHGIKYKYICNGDEKFFIDTEFDSDNRYFGVKAVYMEKSNEFTIPVEK